MRWLATLLVAVHTGVLAGHGAAHRALGVELGLWREIFVAVVIVAAPLVAAVLVHTRAHRAGYRSLAVAMLGALAFGVLHHYLAISPDHVDHLPPGDARGAFEATAAAMTVLEAAAAAVGLVGPDFHLPGRRRR